MQNRYVGDVADFGKHGLLRFLSGMTSEDAGDPLKLGLIWYWHHDEKHVGNRKKINNDGGHIGYLRRTRNDDKSKYRDCDPDLWEKLRDLVYRDARCVHCAELAGILPEGTSYYDAQLYYVPKMSPALRRELRQHWLGEALHATQDAQLVCVDPDNGIASDTKKYNAEGPKYVYIDDLRAIWERRQSLVIYHHLGRGDTDEQIRKVTALLRDGLDTNPDPIPLWFHRGTARLFIVVPQPEHRELIKDRIRRLSCHCWVRNGHFEIVNLQGI